MASTMVKLKPDTHAKLQSIARQEGQTMGDLVTLMLEDYERQQFRKGVIEDLEKFRANTQAYQRYLDEFQEWDNMPDALGDEPPYYEDDEE